MEASLHNLFAASVRVAGDRAIVDNLVVTDETAVRLLRERLETGDNAAALLLDAIEIGARVLDREQAAAQVDVVRAEMEKTARTVDAQFSARAEGVAETLAAQLEAAFGPESGTFSRALDRHFSDDSAGAVQHRVREVMAEVAANMRVDLLRQFSSADGENPLADFKAASVAAIRQASQRQDEALRLMVEKVGSLEREMQGLRDEKAAAGDLADERERGTAKGRTFEEQVFDAVEAIAAAQEDCAEPVGDQLGAGGKKGDILVALEGASGAPRGTLVLEAKDRQRVARRQALADLDAAMQQRAADFALWVVPSAEKLPAGVRDLREVDGNKLFVVFDPEEDDRTALELAYKLARARVLLARTEVDGLDADALADRVELARRALEDVRRIKAQLTSAANGIGVAREAIESLATIVRGHLDEIDELVATARGDD